MGSLWRRSGAIERYADDLPSAGAKAYFFSGGTTTPLVVYQDAGESAAHPHPLEADADGRWPAVFIPYTVAYDERVTTADDVQLTYFQSVPNPDPINLTVTIPATEKVQTGMIHAEFLESAKSGYVRLNGLTLGNAASGATERANADTAALFEYLWNNLSDTLAAVSTGRGASAAADYAANKTITLPDLRATVLVGTDDMGAPSGNLFGGFAFTLGDRDTAGSRIGANGITLTEAQLPAHRHTVERGSPGAGSADGFANNIAVTTAGQTDLTGSGALVNNMPRSILVCWYIKL